MGFSASRCRNGPTGYWRISLDIPKPPQLTYRGCEVDALLGISRSTRYAMQDPKAAQYDPTWPLPVKLSSRVNGYLVAEVQSWLAARPRAGMIAAGPKG